MSATTFALALSKGKAPARQFVRVGKERCREEVFRVALDHYIAEYQKHHAATAGNAGRGAGQTCFAYFRSFAGLFAL